MKPTFLFIQIDGSLGSVAQRVKEEGYPVRIWTSPKAKKNGGGTYGGLFDKTEKVEDYWEVINKYKPNELLIIFDATGLGEVADHLIKEGYVVIGDTSWTDKLEFERTFGNEIAEKIGLKIPPSYEFTSLSLARAFVQKQPDKVKFVFKAEGEEYAGCLSGDTKIRFNRANKGFELSLKQAFEKFNGLYKGPARQWNLSEKTYIRAFTGKEIILYPIIDIVESGVKKTWTLELEDGKFIIATPDHRIMTDRGWVRLDSLTTNDYVFVDNMWKTKKSKKIIDLEKKVGNFHPFARNSKTNKKYDYKRVSVHRLVYESSMNNLSLQDFIEATKSPNNLNYIDTSRYMVHHKDGDHFNNDIKNLQLVTREEHHQIHQFRSHCYPDLVKVIRIYKNPQEEMTYDIICEDPYHNFSANNIIVHNSSKTYTSKNKEDLLDYIEWLVVDTKEKHYHFDKFELQEFIEGKEADFSAYWNGESFIPGSTCLTFEQKKVGDSEYKVGVGQAAGCMGQVLFFLEKSKYFDLYIKKLEPFLKGSKYIGQISINNIISEKDGQPYFLEFTPRWGYDALFSELALRVDAKQSIARFLLDLAGKKSIKFIYNKVAIGVRIYVCAPGADEKDIKGRYFSFPKEIGDDLWFYSVSMEKEKYVAEAGLLLVATSVKEKLSQAITDVYKNIIDKLNIPDIYFRSQIGKNVPETVKFLKEKGWL